MFLVLIRFGDRVSCKVIEVWLGRGGGGGRSTSAKLPTPHQLEARRYYTCIPRHGKPCRLDAIYVVDTPIAATKCILAAIAKGNEQCQ